MGFVGVAPGTTTVQLPDGTTIALADWIDDKIYGSVEFSNSDSSPLEAFSQGRSQTIPGGSRNQTRVDTNIPRQGGTGLPKDWEMLVYGWGIEYTRVSNTTTLSGYSEPADLRTVFDVNRLMFFTFEYNGKKYTEGTPLHYPTGYGISLVTTDTARDLASNGVPSPRDRVALVLPVHMRENLGFQGTFQPEASLTISQSATFDTSEPTMTNLDLKLNAYGLIKRTVV